MDVTITQPDGTAIHMAGPLEDLIAVLRALGATSGTSSDDADDVNDSQQPWGIVRSDYVGTMTVHNTKCPAYSELAHRLNATYVSRQAASWAIRTGWPSFTEGDCSACGTDDTRTINEQPEIGDWSAFTRNLTTMVRTTIHRASCECEPEGRHFHTEIGVTLAAFSLTIHNESAPGIISTADCCY